MMKRIIIVMTLVLMFICIGACASCETLDVTLLFDASQGDSTRLSYAQKCSTDYGYKDIVNHIGSEEMRLLYEAIDEATSAFWQSSADLEAEDVAVAYAYASIDLSACSLDDEQIEWAYHIYRLDHPLYYWLPDGVQLVTNGVSRWLYLCSWEAYASGEYRTKLYSRIQNSISQYASYCAGSSSRYTKATAVLYLMAQKIDYAYNASGDPEEAPWAHSIIGVFDPAYDSAVCEGYARAYQLLMNYLGVPNVYVIGYSGGDTGDTGDWLMHAWNLLQMDDGRWYWTDPTWSDLNTNFSYGYTPVAVNNVNRLDELYYRCRYTYHLKGNEFASNHGPLTSTNSGFMYLYQLPAASAGAYVPDIAGEPALEMPAMHNGRGYQPNFSTSFGVELISAGPIEYVVVQNDGLHRKAVAAAGNGLMRETDSVTIPASVTLNGVEYDVVAVNLEGIAANVKHVVISEGVKWIFGTLSYENMATQSLKIPTTVEYIQTEFLAMDALSEIIVAGGNPYIKSIDGVLYSADGSVLIRYPARKAGESFTLPSGVKELYVQSFRGNRYLKQIDLGSTLERINTYAFGETQSLERLDIPASVALLSRMILTDNPSVKVISISAQTAFVWDSIQGAKALELIELEEGNVSGFIYDGALYMYAGKGAELVFYPSGRAAEIVNVHEDCSKILAYAFTGCQDIGVVQIPAECTVEDGAFFNAHVAELEIADGNKTVNYANGALYSADGKNLQCYLAGCRNEEFTVPDTVEVIDQYAFNCNPYVKRITMSDSVTDVQAFAFKDCTSLESVRLSDNIAWTKDFANYAVFYRGIFQDDVNLKTVNIPAASVHLPYDTFAGCTALESIVLPETLQTIGDSALLGCESLKSVYILNPELTPDNGTNWTRAVLNARMNDVMYIYAESGANVESFLMDADREEVRPGVFRDINMDPSTLPASGTCGNGLTWSVSDDGGTLTISGSGAMTDHSMVGTEPEWHWRWSKQVQRIVVEEGVTHIGDYAFYGFEHVSEVSLPESLQTIGWHAFDACSDLTSVFLGRSLENIGPRAFKNCTALAEITFLSCPEIENSVFENVTATVYYIESMWAEFGEFIDAVLTWVPYTDAHPIGVVSECKPAYSVSDGVIGSVTCLDCGTEIRPASAVSSEKIAYTGSGISKLTAEMTYGDAEQLVITADVKEIGSRAFEGGAALQLVIVPDSVVTIADDAFAGAEEVIVYCYAGSYCESWLKAHTVRLSYVAARPSLRPGFITADEQTLYPSNGNYICPGTQWMAAFANSSLNGCIGHEDAVWASSDEGIAYVDPRTGRIVPGTVGTALLSCTVMQHLELSAEVTVTDARPEGMQLAQNEIVISAGPGSVIDLPELIFTPDGCMDAVCIYKPDDSLGRLTEDGRFEADGAIGTTDIRYVSAGGLTAVCHIQSNGSVQIRYDETRELWAGLPGGRNSTLQLECVTGINLENHRLEWFTFTDKVAIDENGLVTARRGGDVRVGVRIYDADGLYVTESDLITLQVHEALAIQGGSLQMYLSGGPLTIDLNVEYLLEDIPQSEVTWSLQFGSGENNATIDADGLLTVNWPTAFVVRAETADGYWAEKYMNVFQGITEIRSNGPFDLAYGESAVLPLFTFYPDNVQGWSNNISFSDEMLLSWDNVTLTESDPEGGRTLSLRLTGEWAGEVTVTFTDTNTGLSATCAVIVTTVPCDTHTVVVQEAVPPTCTLDGTTEWQACPTCGTVIEKWETLLATGHMKTVEDLKAATADEDGFVICANCDVIEQGVASISKDCILTLPAGLKVIDSNAFQSTAAQQLVIPAGVTTIGSNAFADCKGLMLAVLPDGVTSIAADAFANSNVIIIASAGSYASGWALEHGYVCVEQ